MTRREKAGFLLAAGALICCLTAHPLGPHTVSERYEASGREGTFQRPLMPDGAVRINEADAEELMALPGVGETIAQAILAEREAHGSFHYPEDLCAVRGIGMATLARFRAMLDMTE